MREIRYHKTREKVNYCFEIEIPKSNIAEFYTWMSDNRFFPFRVDEAPDVLVYRPSHIREFLNLKGYSCVEIIEDQGHLTRDIARGIESKLEIMD